MSSLNFFHSCNCRDYMALDGAADWIPALVPEAAILYSVNYSVNNTIDADVALTVKYQNSRTPSAVTIDTWTLPAATGQNTGFVHLVPPNGPALEAGSLVSLLNDGSGQAGEYLWATFAFRQ
jgi:hypothetical protein